MEIIACIPELPCPPLVGAAGPSACAAVAGAGIAEGRRCEEQVCAGPAEAGRLADAGASRPGSHRPANTAPTAVPEDDEPIERGAFLRRPAGRRRTLMCPPPSVLILAVIAAAVWAAAWRNERLRAIEQRRPQRVAMEPASAAAAARTVTP